MDKDLPVRDFCPLHLAAMAQSVALSEDKPPNPGAGKALWLTLMASLLVHATLLTVWTPRPAGEAIAPEPSLRLSLNTTVTDTALTEAVPDQKSPAVEAPIAPELPPPLENTAETETVQGKASPAAEQPITSDPTPQPTYTAKTEEAAGDKPPVDIHALDIAPHQVPASSKPAPGNVFHPGLRDQISEARTRRERLHNAEQSVFPSWQDASGSTWVDLGNGKCMRSAGDTWGATKNWELPTRCKGQLTDGESMLRTMQRTLDRH